MNKIMLIGRVGHTPDIINNDGGRFAKVSLATSERYTKDGEKKEITDWHTLIIPDRLVNTVEKYCPKGKQIYVEGRMRYRKFTGKDGAEKTAAEVMVSGIELLGSKEDSQPAGPNPTPQQASMPTPTPAQQDLFANNDNLPF